MKIQFIRPAAPLGYAYTDPQEVVVEKAFGKEMIELGYAVELEEGETEFPENFPGRRVLEANGFRSPKELERIATIDQLVEIKGIGEKLAESIINELNSPA